MKDNHDFLKNKFLVIGLARSGLAAVDALSKLGAVVAIHDAKNESEVDKEIVEQLNKDNVEMFFHKLPEDLKQFDVMILSPGVNPNLDFVAKARKQGVKIIGEMELAYLLSKGKFISITGTNGKTTTTTLVGEIFKKSGRNTSVVGNIGFPAVKEVIGKGEEHWFIAETSSFQLETVIDFKPVVSAILNLTPDHLDRHGTFENYGDAKATVFANQDENQYLVINKDDKSCMELLERNKCNAKIAYFSRKTEVKLGTFCQGDTLVVKNEKGEVIPVCEKSDIKIIGQHNLENVLAAMAICYFAGIDKDTIASAIKEFGGVEHRIEFCKNIGGVDYYNDSKGTNVDASVTAIKALDKNIILIAGGEGKAQDFTELAEYFPGHLNNLIVLGKDKDQIAKAAKKVGFQNIHEVENMAEAVKVASNIAKAGDKVLLSPACASWDMYNNFEERGQDFKEQVEGLAR